jgi:hypothetical protein
MSAVRRAGRAAAGLLPAAALARLGVPALAAVVFLAVLALGAACWVIANGDRSDRVTRMIYARRGASGPWSRDRPLPRCVLPAVSWRGPSATGPGPVPGRRAIRQEPVQPKLPDHDVYQR